MAKKTKNFWIRAENPLRDIFFTGEALKARTMPTRKSRSMRALRTQVRRANTRAILDRHG